MVRLVFLLLIFGSFSIFKLEALWPSFNDSHIQLLALFPDDTDTTHPTTLSVHARAMFHAAMILSRRYNITVEGKWVDGRSTQTGGNYINALSGVCESITRDRLVGIVGPAFSREASIIATFARRIGLPVVSYAATNPELTDRKTYPAFYRTVPSDDTAAYAIFKLFQRYNWTSCVIIYQNDAFGSGGAQIIKDIFNANNFTVQKTIVFDITQLTFQGDLETLLINSASRIVIVWADVTVTSTIVRQGLAAHVIGPQFTWILSSSISLNIFNQSDNAKLIGMFTVEPVVGSLVAAPINRTLLDAAYEIWQEYEPETFPGSANVDNYGLFAFDATWLIILALQSFCSLSVSNQSCVASEQSSLCFNYRFLNSNALLETITKTSFLGITGHIQFNENTTNRIDGIHYYVQNIQESNNHLKYVAVLKYSIGHGWETYADSHTIVWPGNALVPTKDVALLKGVNLDIALIQSSPFLFVSYEIDSMGLNKTKFSGYIPDLIEALRNRLGFNPNLVLVPSNQTYAQTIDALANGVYDLIIGDVTVTANRREKVAFSNSIFDNSLRIIMRDSTTVSIDWFSYLRPFSRTLWLVLLGTWIYAAACVLFLERQSNEVLRERTWFASIGMSLWFSIGVIIGFGADYHMRTAAGRILTIGLYIVSLVLVATYTANLASDLTISKSKSIITGIDDIKLGKIPYSRIGIRPGTSIEEYYLREISGGNRNYYPLRTRQEQYDALLNGIIDATFMDIGVAEYVTNNVYCNLTLVDTDFDKSSFGIVMPKEWLHAKEFDVNILTLRETGVLDNLKKKWFQSRVCPTAETMSTAMEIESLAGLFLTFAVISFVSIAVRLWWNFHPMIMRLILPVQTTKQMPTSNVELR